MKKIKNFDYGFRAKIRIIGKHPATNDIKDDELPWAHFLLPPTFGSGNNNTLVSVIFSKVARQF